MQRKKTVPRARSEADREARVVFPFASVFVNLPYRKAFLVLSVGRHPKEGKGPACLVQDLAVRLWLL